MSLDQLGPYRIVRTIGRGGMGAVYSGIHVETGQRVAVKVLSTVLAENDRFRERFQIEIETLKKLSHENIVQLFGFGEHDGHLFYSMELVEGRNLQQELKTGRRFKWSEAIAIGTQICHALKHAHDHGVIHRDLKPSNLLYTIDEHVKLTDFGIAKLFGASHMTADGSALGTADYMSPEQAAGKPVTARTDLYSLGGVLFALVSGHPPYPAASAAEVLHRVRFDAVPSIRDLVPDIPEEFDRILKALLAKDPAERIATALLLGKQLQALSLALSEDTQVDGPLDPDELSQAIDLDHLEFSDSDIALQQTTPNADARSTRQQHLATSDAPTEQQRASAEQPVTREPRIGKRRNFTSVDRKHSDAQDPWSRVKSTFPWSTVFPALGLVTIVGGTIWAVLNTISPDSIDDRFQQISRAHEIGVTELRSQEPNMRSFLKSSKNDARSNLVREWLSDVEIHDHVRRLERESRRRGGIAFLRPENQAFLLAWRTRQSNQELSRQRFQQLVDAFGSLPSKSRQVALVVRLAQHELRQMTLSPPNRGNDQSQRLQDYVDQLDRSLSGAERQRALKGILDLFGGQPWAADVLQDCQRRLARSDDSTTGDSRD